MAAAVGGDVDGGGDACGGRRDAEVVTTLGAVGARDVVVTSGRVDRSAGALVPQPTSAKTPAATAARVSVVRTTAVCSARRGGATRGARPYGGWTSLRSWR